MAPSRSEATLVTTNAPWRAISAASGDAEALARAVANLRDAAETRAIVFDEHVVALQAERLEQLGFRRVVRQYFVQNMSSLRELQSEFVSPSQPLVSGASREGLRFVPLQDASVQGQARELFARTHAETLEGYYFSAPEAPTPQRCREAFDAEQSGPHCLPSTAVAALDGDTVLGFVSCTQADPNEPPALAALAVSPDARRRGLARLFVRHVQNSLIRLGFTHAAFLTTDRNAAIHKLFDPGGIVKRESYPVWFWERR